MIAAAGIAWNAFGVVQLLQTLRSTPESLVRMGMTPMQASVYASYPAWMNVAFAVGAFGGLLGSLALLLSQTAAAKKVFAASLLGYVVLFVGDLTEGVFAALGASQVAILTFVIAVAAGLLAWTARIDARGRA
ncbi:MAG: hypothetical protein JST00_21560 [Deltaproteobacteria bacterium]|nr:hypothetical protein [Deltaproteobacteria bacterium]